MGFDDDQFSFASFDDMEKMFDDKTPIPSIKSQMEATPESADSSAIYDKKIEKVGLPDELKRQIDEIAKSAEASVKAMELNPVDAEVKITVRQSRLEALIVVNSPQNGGKHITYDVIQREIDNQKITYGIDNALLMNIVNERLYDTIFTFASGDSPKNGIDGYVKPRFDEARKMKPKLLEDGSVDYRDLGKIVNIAVGDTIADIKSETKGVSGRDIYGQVITAINGKMPPLPIGQNTGLNGDRTKIIALQDGNLIYKQGKFEVETTVTISESVNISTGNIRFVGDVLIKGNVDEGFLVESDKDITINGMVNGATVKANGNITVKNGVINSLVISKGGAITVGFAESSKIRCHGALTAGSLVSCIADIEGSIDVTKNPGTIVGGTIRSMDNIICNTLGHRNYIATVLYLGNFDSLVEEKKRIDESIEEIDMIIQKITMTLDLLAEQKRRDGHLAKEKEDFISAAVRMRLQKVAEKKPITKRLLEIETLMSDDHNVTVKVNRFLHPNVRVSIGRNSLQTSTECGKCVIYTSSEGVKISLG